MKGDYDDAIANAIGSNIFDICFALGFPRTGPPEAVKPSPLSVSHSKPVVWRFCMGAQGA